MNRVDVRRALEAALADRDHARRHPRDELLGASRSTASVRRLRLLTPIDRRAGVERHGQLLGIVHLDERIEAELRLRAPTAA